MIKYEVVIAIEYDSWGSSCDIESFQHTVSLHGVQEDNYATLKTYGSSEESLADARAFAYDVYNVMDHSEVRLVDRTR